MACGNKGSINSCTINWSSVDKVRSYSRDEITVKDLYMEINRRGADRSHDLTYDFEKELLDAAGETEYIHRVFRVDLFPTMIPIFIEFTPEAVKFGATPSRKQ